MAGLFPDDESVDGIMWMNAGQVEGREEVRRGLRGAGVRGLLKNRFAGAGADSFETERDCLSWCGWASQVIVRQLQSCTK